MFCPLTSSLYPLSPYLFSGSGQPFFHLPNSLLPVFWEVLFYPTPCYHTIIHRVTVNTAMFICDLAPLSTMLTASGVDIWPKLAQAVVLLPEIWNGTSKSSCLADLLEVTCNPLLTILWSGLGKLVFREIKKWQNSYTYWGELDLGAQRMLELFSLSLSSAFLCDAYMGRQALFMKRKWWPPPDPHGSRPPEEKSSLFWIYISHLPKGFA